MIARMLARWPGPLLVAYALSYAVSAYCFCRISFWPFQWQALLPLGLVLALVGIYGGLAGPTAPRWLEWPAFGALLLALFGLFFVALGTFFCHVAVLLTLVRPDPLGFYRPVRLLTVVVGLLAHGVFVLSSRRMIRRLGQP